MSRNTRSDHKDAQLRRTAVKRYRAGIPASAVARQLHRSRSWVYKWVHYRNHHPWTRFRSASRASLHHPNRLSAKSERRIIHLRQLLMRHRQPRLRFALLGARTLQKEWRRRYPEPPPSLRTIQRVLKRHHLTTQAPRPCHHAYRPHPAATYPHAVHVTDSITRWMTGGEVVQTFNTVDISSNDVCSSSHATKTATVAREHLLHTWQQLGVPDRAQFDNESAFSGGNHPWVLGKVVRLCLYMGIEVVSIRLTHGQKSAAEHHIIPAPGLIGQDDRVILETCSLLSGRRTLRSSGLAVSPLSHRARGLKLEKRPCRAGLKRC